MELERQAPVPIDPDRPPPTLGASERMQTEARKVHVPDRLRGLERGQKYLESIGMIRLNACQRARLKEPSQSLVAKGLDHRTI